MTLLMTCFVAVNALRRNAMRTALTALGMIIGVASVIVMVALGSGAQASIEAQIRSAGSNLVIVTAGSAGFGPVRQGQGATTTLTAADAEAIQTGLAGIRYLSPGVNLRTQVIAENSNWGTQIQGAGGELPDLRSWPVQSGSFFTDQDVTRAARVAVLGAVARDQLFGPGADPIGDVIRIRNQPFRVVGVLSRKGQAAMGQDQDDTIVVPFTTAQKRLLGITHIQNIWISAAPDVALDRLSTDIADLLRNRHRIEPGDDDFMVRTLEEMASVLMSTTTTMRWLLAAVAAVSLIVGGIGIMNIMLVSVTERTKEIGLRLSVGARDVDVLLQFLTEAIVLSGVGGAIGVAVGFAASYVVGRVMQWSAAVTPGAVLLAFTFAVTVGVFFGFYPARKAASLNPIEALRYE